MSSAIEVRNLWINAPETGAPIIGPVDVSVAPGEQVGLVGMSGVGKSTLLRAVAGLVTPARGAVHVAGRAGQGARIGYVPQTASLLPWLSALENVLAPTRLGRAPWTAMSADASRVDAQRLLAHFGLGAAQDLRPLALSGGMQSRVALARALANAPDIVLLDEPFVSLDEVTAAQIQEVLAARLKAQKCTSLLVSHEIDQAIRMCDRVIVMGRRPGVIVADFDCRDISESDAAASAMVRAIRRQMAENADAR
jgi:NitT/TauT family transport system ATP-binding protein